MIDSVETSASSAHVGRFAMSDSLRPALRAVFHRGPEGLTMRWVAEREWLGGEVQIIVGDPLPNPEHLIDMVERSVAYSAAD